MRLMRKVNEANVVVVQFEMKIIFFFIISAAHAGREVGELRTQLEENEEELSELIKKYSSVVKQLNSEQLKHSEYETTISELEAEKASLKEQISELNDRLENVEVLNDSSTNIQTKR